MPVGATVHDAVRAENDDPELYCKVELLLSALRTAQGVGLTLTQTLTLGGPKSAEKELHFAEQLGVVVCCTHTVMDGCPDRHAEGYYMGGPPKLNSDPCTQIP